MPLPPAASPVAREAMATAFKELEKIVSPADAKEFSDTTLQQVRDAAIDIETRLAARQCLRNMRRLKPLFGGLEHYAQVMGVLCNGTPYMPWTWAPISLVLRISCEHLEAFEQIIKAYSRLAEPLKRFCTLAKTSVRDSDLQQALAVYYVDILRFHGYTYKFIRRSNWNAFFMTSWGRFQRRFDTTLEDLKRHENLINAEANLRDSAEVEKMRRDVRQWREESYEKLLVFEQEQNAKQFESIVSWLKVDESDQLAIFDAISAEGARYPGTSSWVHQNAKVKAWLRRSPDPPILWMKGTPGSGKSVLATQLISFMRDAHMFVACHMCTYSYASSTSYDQILRSLLLQLLRKDGELVAHVYNQCVLGKKSPTVGLLELLLQALVESLATTPNQVEYVWIVLDGLDECDSNKQSRVVTLIRQMTEKAASSGNVICKVLVSSRTSPAISDRLRRAEIISLGDEKNALGGAIQQYAHHRLRSLHHKLGQLQVGMEDLDDLVRIVSNKADGMFLYARLVLDFIASDIFYNREELKSSVNELPQKLVNFYRDVLARALRNMKALSVERIKCILGWIAFSKRPLKKLEFLSAVTYSSGDPDVSHLVPQYILDIMASLIEERRDATLGFIHVSVKDFLQSSSSPVVISEADAINEHGIASVACLLNGCDMFGTAHNEQDRFTRLVEGLHGFHIYANEHWTEYLLAHVASPDYSAHAPLSKLLSLALDLAARLHSIEPTGDNSPDDSSECKRIIQDERLSLLHQHPTLYRCVLAHLRARSPEGLESELLASQPMASSVTGRRSPLPPQPVPRDGLSSVLASYQSTLEALLEQPDFPGISAEEFERFKSQFRTAAFTCRLRTCPRATLGFESSQLRREHETSHVRQFPCAAADCQFPPFSSASALQRHVSKYHSSTSHVPRQSIRDNKTTEGHAAGMVELWNLNKRQESHQRQSNSNTGAYKPLSPSSRSGLTNNTGAVEAYICPHYECERSTMISGFTAKRELDEHIRLDHNGVDPSSSDFIAWLFNESQADPPTVDEEARRRGMERDGSELMPKLVRPSHPASREIETYPAERTQEVAKGVSDGQMGQTQGSQEQHPGVIGVGQLVAHARDAGAPDIPSIQQSQQAQVQRQQTIQRIQVNQLQLEAAQRQRQAKPQAAAAAAGRYGTPWSPPADSRHQVQPDDAAGVQYLLQPAPQLRQGSGDIQRILHGLTYYPPPDIADKPGAQIMNWHQEIMSRLRLSLEQIEHCRSCITKMDHAFKAHTKSHQATSYEEKRRVFLQKRRVFLQMIAKETHFVASYQKQQEDARTLELEKKRRQQAGIFSFEEIAMELARTRSLLSRFLNHTDAPEQVSPDSLQQRVMLPQEQAAQSRMGLSGHSMSEPGLLENGRDSEDDLRLIKGPRHLAVSDARVGGGDNTTSSDSTSGVPVSTVTVQDLLLQDAPRVSSLPLASNVNGNGRIDSMDKKKSTLQMNSNSTASLNQSQGGDFVLFPPSQPPFESARLDGASQPPSIFTGLINTIKSTFPYESLVEKSANKGADKSNTPEPAQSNQDLQDLLTMATKEFRLFKLIVPITVCISKEQDKAWEAAMSARRVFTRVSQQVALFYMKTHDKFRTSEFFKGYFKILRDFSELEENDIGGYVLYNSQPEIETYMTLAFEIESRAREYSTPDQSAPTHAVIPSHLPPPGADISRTCQQQFAPSSTSIAEPMQTAEPLSLVREGTDLERQAINQLPPLPADLRLQLLAIDEPERCCTWAGCVLQEDIWSSIQLTALWEEYNSCFEQSMQQSGRAMISIDEFISYVKRTSPWAAVEHESEQTPEGEVKKLVINGIRPRMTPINPSDLPSFRRATRSLREGTDGKPGNKGAVASESGGSTDADLKRGISNQVDSVKDYEMRIELLDMQNKKRFKMGQEEQNLTDKVSDEQNQSDKPKDQEQSDPPLSLHRAVFPSGASVSLPAGGSADLFRPWELVWYEHVMPSSGVAWRLGIVLRPPSPSTSNPSPTNAAVPAPSLVRVAPLDVAGLQPPEMELNASALRPFLSLSVPPIHESFRHIPHRQAAWQQLVINAQIFQQRAISEAVQVPLLPMPALSDTHLIAVEASKAAANLINRSFSVFNALPNASSTKSAYGGVFLGAELVVIGDALRVYTWRGEGEGNSGFFGENSSSSNDFDVMRVDEILQEGKLLWFMGDVYSLVQVAPHEQPPPPPDGQVFTEELNDRKQFSSTQWYWRLKERRAMRSESSVLGRFYTSPRLAANLQNPAYLERAALNQLPWHTSYGHGPNMMASALNRRMDVGGFVFFGRPVASRAAMIGDVIRVPLPAIEGVHEGEFREGKDFAAMNTRCHGEDTGLLLERVVSPPANQGPDSGQASSSSPRTFACDECSRVFDQFHKLKRHKRYHERPHDCTVAGCDKRFGTKTHLDRHMSGRHGKSRKYHCTAEGCPFSVAGGKSFPRKDNWRRHMVNKHGVHPDHDPVEAVDQPTKGADEVDDDVGGLVFTREQVADLFRAPRPREIPNRHSDDETGDPSRASAEQVTRIDHGLVGANHYPPDLLPVGILSRPLMEGEDSRSTIFRKNTEFEDVTADSDSVRHVPLSPVLATTAVHYPSRDIADTLIESWGDVEARANQERSRGIVEDYLASMDFENQFVEGSKERPISLGEESESQEEEFDSQEE